MNSICNLLFDSEYGRRIANRLRWRARRRLGIHDAQLIHSPEIPYRETLSDLLDQSVADGRITNDEADHAEGADIVIAGRADNGAPRYVVCQVAFAIALRHTEHAREQGDIIARAAGAASVPAVVGIDIAEAAQQRAAELGVTVIIMPD